MSQKKQSKEEQFLLRLYEFASKKGGPQTEVDRYEVGEIIGQRTKQADHTVQVLTKNGLIEKTDEKLICLTDFGLKFVKNYLLV